MSDEQKESSENETRCESALSTQSNQTDSSESTRSTLIKEILTSDKSKELVNEIDQKISQLVDHINSKKYSGRRKKYYTKKIVNKIIESKYSETSINTLNFAHTLPSSTPYSTEKDSAKTSKLTINNENEKSEPNNPISKISSDVLVETPKIYSPNHLNVATKETKTLITEIEKNVSEVKVNLGSKTLDIPKETKHKTNHTGNVLEIITVQKGMVESQKTQHVIDEKVNNGETILTLIVKNGDKNIIIKPILENHSEKSKNSTQTTDSNYELNLNQLDSNDSKSSKENSDQGTSSKEISLKDEDNHKEKFISKDKKRSKDVKSSEEGSLTQQYKKTFKNEEKKDNAQFNNIKDLTPRTLCKIYKLEFNESSTSSSNTKSSSAINEDEIDNPITRSKDWKYYKTTSEELFEKSKRLRNKQTSTSEEDCAVEYAKKERHRQIMWINSEIRWLTKLKLLLEKTNYSGSFDSGSVASTLYKQPSKRLVDYDSTLSNGSKTLKDINTCLEELQKVLKEKTKQESRTGHSNKAHIISSSEKTTSEDKTQSSSKDSVCYQDIMGVSKTVSKPTEFEIKYFRKNHSSSGSYNDTDKENICGNIYNQIQYSTKNCKCDFAVQTSLRSSPCCSQPCCSKRVIRSEKKSYDISLQTNLSNGYCSNNSTVQNGKPIAYFLTFEEMQNNNKNKDENVKKDTALKKVKVQVPFIPKQDSNKKDNDSVDLELQEYLLKNRSDFVKSAEWRRQCINELMYMRDKRNADLKQRLLFTTKEMRHMTDKKYNKTEEVQNKLKKRKCEMQKAFNRQLASLFSKKLQEKTLKGQVTISTSKTVIYS